MLKKLTLSIGTDFSNNTLGEFEVYEPLVSGLKLTNKEAVWMTVIMIYRRIILTYVAMFLEDYAWIQVIVFMLMCLA